ncbi:type I polyketide synthase [Actinocorallia populi]|uniref:type I polyketide synthase n=1 Tax=Actinocorallia populi TaxID=2079200 RepID=UPI000D095EF8|nr:type I polyketide synthase [Actinocorallia populi]
MTGEPRTRGGVDAVAIVAMGCRYPGGVRSPADLWRLVAEGTDATSEFPDNRGWDLPEGMSSTTRGGFLHDADLFDAKFFGISPRESEGMDPQQRVLMEVAWETFERAGLERAGLSESNTGVFVGAMAQEYGPRMYEEHRAGGHRLTGSTPSVASGRIAYHWGLRGPAVTVDTACSASLVAVHLAVRSLLDGECDMALAGGVALMPTPGIFVDFSRQGGLSADGRCHSFSDDACGTAWAEGAGLLLLEREEDAKAKGHRILALIRGSAVNSDGASNGLTAPSRPAQEDVIRRALRRAGLGPHDVDAVEAHGTGTELGDPIEARALAEVYGKGRDPRRPLYLGSFKSNIGHAQAAAGVAGVIKLVEALRAGVLPRTLNVTEPTRHVDWRGGNLALLTEAREWPRGERPRRAGVSSFGISGTNAHVVLEEPPAPVEAPAPSEPAKGPFVWSVSAPSAEALKLQARTLGERLGPEDAPQDVAASLALRSRFAHRGTVVADDIEGLRAGLAKLASGSPVPTAPGRYVSPTVLRTESWPDPTGPVFVFPGQGSQWREMGLALMERSKAFRDGMRACARELAPLTGRRLTDMLRSDDLDRVDVVQPAIFAVMVSLARLWESVGVRPAAVVGASQGEIAAAHIAGALSLADACKVVVLRSKALTELAGTGAMASLPLGVAETRALLDHVDGVGVAAVNAPTATVVSGGVEGIAELMALCESRGVDARRIEVDYASHGPAVDMIEDTVRRELADVTPLVPSVPMYSTLTGSVIDTAATDGGYWFDNLRDTVRFEPVIRRLVERRHRVFIEVSPHPVLTFGVQEVLDESGVKGTVLGSLRRGSGGLAQFLANAAALPDSAGPVDPSPLQPAGRRIELPTYAFDRTRHWAAPKAGGSGGPVRGFGCAATDLPSGQTVVTATIDTARHSWITDHVVQDTVLVPATAFLSLLTEASGGRAITELTLGAALPLTGDGTAELRVMIGEGGTVTVFSRQPDGWLEHASGVLGDPAAAPRAPQWPPADASPVDLTRVYADLAARGYHYGPAFQGLRALWTRGDEAFAEVALPERVTGAGSFATAHPALLDAALHAAVVRNGGGLAVPFAWRDVTLPASSARSLRVHLVARDGEYSVNCFDDEGGFAGSAGGLGLRPIGSGDEGAVLELAWTPVTGQETRKVEWARLDFPDLDAVPYPIPRTVVVALAPNGGDVPAEADELAITATGLIQGWLADRRFGSSRLAFVTRGALAATEREPVRCLASSVVTGLVRAAQSEHPDTFLLVDLDDDPASGKALGQALACGEPEVAVRGGELLRPRLRAAKDDGLLAPPQGAWRLDVTRRGTLDDLALIPHPEAEAALGPREVRLEVRAAGLNFRDVTVGLGLVPTERFMGSEGSGVVLEVGSEVTGFVPGDKVFGMFDRSLGPVAVADERMIRPLPGDWSHAEAATIPIVYITAYQCLVDVANVQAGESVLIHTATGGVGLAAIQLARHLGADVFATAGPAKQPLLRAMGVPADHIASSRELAFAGEFRAATGGRGVDVVLNSLANQAIDDSLALLAPGGRFAEMGKTDLRDKAVTEAEHPGITYEAYNIYGQTPERIGQVLDALVALFAAGALSHIPVRTWDVRHGRVPLRMLSRAKHRGKLVLTMPRAFDPGRPALITGGTGGLGARLARHLVAAHGASSLLLLSRQGPQAPGARELKAELEDLGATVAVLACDAGDESAIAKVVVEYAPGSVFHTAGVLDDAMIDRLTPAQVRAVTRPKVAAAWNLHRLTLDLDLSAFVLFSSAISLVGGPGQANYAAANAFLNSLAQQRRAQGLEATALAWGLWGEATGMTGHLSESDHAALARIGLAPLRTRDGFRLLDEALRSASSLLVPMRTDLAGVSPGSRAATLFDGLDGSGAGVAKTAGAPSSSGARKQDGGEHTPASLLSLVRTQAAEVLGHTDAAVIGPEEVFKELGFDSLLSVDLRNRLNAATGLRLPAGAALDHPTPRLLVEFMLTRLDGS